MYPTLIYSTINFDFEDSLMNIMESGSPIFIPRKHPKQNYRAQARAAKKRSNVKKFKR